ncbi:hypothetical protein [Oxynema aestuarii]|uniref:Uncharacterized protein n=1 Tax=Oxynema aestuarii AP17 TaxID=2064643 RepID=A0A6H1TSH8_9CYAN|nr:hypothetical protein [Oxynema aestuarii]QIZ69166.1 hypothetical protein HCG48_21555 [Oxynema aestuarii AP17]
MESVDQRKILNLHGQQHRSRIVLETEHKQVYPDLHGIATAAIGSALGKPTGRSPYNSISAAIAAIDPPISL